jgi:hypothetical protein
LFLELIKLIFFTSSYYNNMSSFFASSDKIKVGQTSVSVPAENGLDYRPGGKIDIYVPPTSKFVDLSQSKLKLNVSLALPSGNNNKMRLQLDPKIGLHSLIRSIRIFSGRKTALLEEIEGYDILTALRFDYETNDNLKSKRALTEGSVQYDPACRSTLGSLKTTGGNCFSNPYFAKVPTVNPTLSTSFASSDPDYDFHVAKGELHLNTGLFRNEAVFPSLLTDGIFIEILLQDSKKVFRGLDSTNRNRRLHLNPVFHSINGSDAGSASWADAAVHKSFYLSRDNNQTSTQVCPLVVGEKITVVSNTDTLTVNGSIGTIEQIEQDTSASIGNSKTKITLSASITNNTGTDWNRDNNTFFVVSDTVESATSGYDPTYTISDVELLVEQIEVPPGYEQSMMNMMKEGGTMNYDYRTFTNYRYSQLQGDNVANIRLPLIESRATSILCVPTDATAYSARSMISCSNTYVEFVDSQDKTTHSSRSGLVGICDELQDYQFIYDGKINPSRKVDTSKIAAKDSISQQWCIEAEKALAMSDIEPLSFMSFQENFFIGRALALGKNAVYDARGKDFNLQVEYTGTQQSKPKLWNNFVSHLRSLEIKNGGLMVMR